MMNRATRNGILGGLVLLAVAWIINGPLTDMKIRHIVKEEMRNLTMMPAANDAHIVFYDEQGNARALTDFRGQVVLLNLWATWCPPCIEEMPVLAALEKRYGDALRVVAVSTDSAGFTAMQSFFEKHPVAHPTPYWDQGMRLFTYLKIKGLPTTYVINREGQTVAKLERVITENDRELIPLLDQLTAQ